MENYTTGVQHIGLPTKDIAATQKFYQQLGFEPAFETVFDGAKISFLKLQNLVMEVYESKDATEKAGAIDHVAINVMDIDKTYRQVCDMGLNTMQDEIHFLPFWENGVKFFTIQGPNAEKVEFSQFL